MESFLLDILRLLGLPRLVELEIQEIHRTSTLESLQEVR